MLLTGRLVILRGNLLGLAHFVRPVDEVNENVINDTGRKTLIIILGRLVEVVPVIK